MVSDVVEVSVKASNLNHDSVGVQTFIVLKFVVHGLFTSIFFLLFGRLSDKISKYRFIKDKKYLKNPVTKSLSSD